MGISDLKPHAIVHGASMSTDLVPLRDKAGSTPAPGPVPDILEAWLAAQPNPQTRRAYRADIDDFARSAGAASPGAAVEALLAGSAGQANAIALAYRVDLERRDLAAATVARKLAAIRSLVRLARTLGRIGWTLDVRSPKVTTYRDTHGPGQEGWIRIRDEARRRASGSRRTIEAKRNLALLLLLRDLGLRRAEATGLDLPADVDLDWQGPHGKGRVRIIGKGKTDPEWISLNEPTRAALLDWITPRGTEPGPLFHRLDNAQGDGPPARLTGLSVNRMVARAGRHAGLQHPVRAHGLRHLAITRILDKTGGDVRSAKAFSRHSKYETLMRYDDNREDVAGLMAKLLADD
jgi:integrase/recombinase XerC